MTTPTAAVSSKVPAWVGAILDISFDGVNFEATNVGQHHNEWYARTACNRDDWFNDNFDISTYKTAKKFFFQVDINSEVPIGLYNKGTVVFAYDLATQKWGMNAMVNGAKWLFCSPDSVISRVFEGIDCLVRDTEDPITDEDLDAVLAITNSVKGDWSGILKRSALYHAAEGDCKKVRASIFPGSGFSDVAGEVVY